MLPFPHAPDLTPAAGTPGLPAALHPDALILAVDDQAPNLRILERMLRRVGYSRILTTTDSRETRALVEAHAPDIVLLDWHMPHMDGQAVLEDLADHLSGDAPLPVLIRRARPPLPPATRRNRPWRARCRHPCAASSSPRGAGGTGRS